MKKIIGAVLLLLVLGVAGYFYFKQPPQPQYKTQKVERGSIVSTVSATGTLNAVVTVQVGTQVSGTISKLYVDFNSQVKKGQAIAQIDPALFLSAVQQSRGNALNAEASLAKARVTLADAKRTYNRNKALLAEGIIAQSDLDAAQTAYDAALAGVRGAEAVLLQTRGALRQAETNLNYAIIKSPVDGIVVSRNVDVGQTVAASFQTPTLFTIAQDLTKMQIDTSIDESDISRLKVGQKAEFTVDAYPEQTFEGSVVQIRNAPVVTQNVVTYVAVIGVDNRQLLLKPGMTANVAVQTMRKDDLFKVPTAALRFKPKAEKGKEKDKGKGGKGAGMTATAPKGSVRMQGEGRSAAANGAKQTVYLLKGEGKAVPVAITTGISDGASVEVVSGAVKEGDDVIIEQVSQDKKKSGMGGSPMGPRF
ncbi:efflux RND transporter periplasmic adaptor subunit [Citrifermentans bremense]|uniref:efflux RND transporter periplasmic adaptor subunit n=1 Tax=Citrifermentans bremense TaxID=60035 RepID=UPI0004008C7E|nr:efflux RND transporter periplasmic adaptor subunit [Citrifermentans bremense]